MSSYGSRLLERREHFDSLARQLFSGSVCRVGAVCAPVLGNPFLRPCDPWQQGLGIGLLKDHDPWILLKIQRDFCFS